MHANNPAPLDKGDCYLPVAVAVDNIANVRDVKVISPKYGSHLRAMPDDERKFPPSRYNEILDEAFEQIKKLSKFKGDEYAAGADRLANFRDAAKRLDLPMEVIWQVYTQKHWDAITQYVKDTKSGVKRERMEPPSSRVLDIMVYCLLLLCMMEERDGKHVKISD